MARYPISIKAVSASAVIVAVIAFAVAFSIANLGPGVVEHHSSLVAVAERSFCDPLAQSENNGEGGYVVLRLDDVQAFMWTDISMRMMEDAFEFGAPVVAGVIPKGVDQDKSLIHFLRKYECRIEIVQHGWDHSFVDAGEAYGGEEVGQHVPEFAALSEAEARVRLERGYDLLADAVDSGLPKIFIPPNNVISDEAKTAMRKLEYPILSSEGSNPFDYQASTYDFAKTEINPADEVVNTCRESIRQRGSCVIMIHPQDYVDDSREKIDPKEYEEYLNMLRMFSADHVRFVTFTELAKIKGVSTPTY